MARNFPNWLDAYVEYAKDDYCPESFHYWTGVSVLAGALERKVWIVNGKITLYPNLFVFLVTYAGVGKSTAIVRGVELLEDLKETVNPQFRFIDEQITEPAFVKAMSERQEIVMGSRVLYHSSGYFYASEASASALQNTHGNFVATVTGFYDCPKVFRKMTLTNGQLEFFNVSFNMLAGATFDYLKTLVNETSVMGGFASRILYIVSKERLIRTPKWGASAESDRVLRRKLFEDLCEIHRLFGEFRPSREFISAWEAFQPESDRLLASLNSPRLESLAARRSTHVMKMAMILSIAESNNLTLEVRHWEKALEIVDEAMSANAYVISQGAMADKDSQLGVNQAIGQAIKSCGGVTHISALRGMMLSQGIQVDLVAKTVDAMVDAKWIERESNGTLRLLVDPDNNL